MVADPGGTGPPTEPPADWAGLFAVERARLSELLGGLAPTDWGRPSPCPGWSVLGLCAHLAGGDLSLLARHRDHHHGTPPPEGPGEPELIAWLDQLQDEWVRAARRLSPRVVTDLLDWAGPQIVETFRGQDPRARTAEVTWAGPEPAPVWLDQARELSEYWIHRQQLLQAVGRPSDLRPDLAAPVLDALRWAYPFRLRPVAARPGDTVTIAVSGPVTVTWSLVATEAGWAFRAGPGPREVARLELSTGQAWRLLTSNLPADGRAGLISSGDPAILALLDQTRAIIGTPR